MSLYQKFENKCVSYIYFILLRLVFNLMYKKETGPKIRMSSVSRIGPIPK